MGHGAAYGGGAGGQIRGVLAKLGQLALKTGDLRSQMRQRILRLGEPTLKPPLKALGKLAEILHVQGRMLAAGPDCS